VNKKLFGFNSPDMFFDVMLIESFGVSLSRCPIYGPIPPLLSHKYSIFFELSNISGIFGLILLMIINVVVIAVDSVTNKTQPKIINFFPIN
jgi:hypothetical protein